MVKSSIGSCPSREAVARKRCVFRHASRTNFDWPLNPVLPAWSTSLAPASTFSTESPIRLLISFAAAAERCARLRTSDARPLRPTASAARSWCRSMGVRFPAKQPVRMSTSTCRASSTTTAATPPRSSTWPRCWASRNPTPRLQRGRPALTRLRTFSSGRNGDASLPTHASAASTMRTSDDQPDPFTRRTGKAWHGQQTWIRQYRVGAG